MKKYGLLPFVVHKNGTEHRAGKDNKEITKIMHTKYRKGRRQTERSAVLSLEGIQGERDEDVRAVCFRPFLLFHINNYFPLPQYLYLIPHHPHNG